MADDNLSYDHATCPIPVLSIEFIEMALGKFTDDNSFETMLQSLITNSVTDIHGNERHILINENKDGPFWCGDRHTPITFILRWSSLFRGYNLHGRIAQLVSVLYLKCGIPVTGMGPAFENPLTICVTNGNIQAATALLRDTDACFADPSEQRHLLKIMVESRQTTMLQLFAYYKSRTFPNADKFLNSFEGRESLCIPLFIAAIYKNDPDLVRVLVYDFGAKPDIKNNNKKMVIDLFKDCGDYFDGARSENMDPYRARIIGLLDPEGMASALYMSRHPRLGRESMLQSLPMETMDHIHALSKQYDLYHSST